MDIFGNVDLTSFKSQGVKTSMCNIIECPNLSMHSVGWFPLLQQRPDVDGSIDESPRETNGNYKSDLTCVSSTGQVRIDVESASVRLLEPPQHEFCCFI